MSLHRRARVSPNQTGPSLQRHPAREERPRVDADDPVSRPRHRGHRSVLRPLPGVQRTPGAPSPMMAPEVPRPKGAGTGGARMGEATGMRVAPREGPRRQRRQGRNAPVWTPTIRYPDPAIEVIDPFPEPDRALAPAAPGGETLDPGAEHPVAGEGRIDDRYRVFSAGVERLATGCRWSEGPVWFGDTRALLWRIVGVHTGAFLPCRRCRRGPSRAAGADATRDPRHRGHRSVLRPLPGVQRRGRASRHRVPLERGPGLVRGPRAPTQPAIRGLDARRRARPHR
jgi:hypothetical protein